MTRKNSSTSPNNKTVGVQAVKDERLEDILLSCRNHLRGRAPMTDKRDLLLTLIFLKFIGDRFLARKAAILEEFSDNPEFAKLAVGKASFYEQEGVFFLPEACLWSELVKKEAGGMAIAFDTAIAQLEQNEESLRNALPQQIFTKTALEPAVLKSVVDDISRIDPIKFTGKDLFGRVYEYFLQAFSINADKEEGEFYTPHSIVELIASLIEPFGGTIYDPCCGSGGMFVQSTKFIEAHGRDPLNVTVYGQESEPSTFRLAKMNLAVRGISYHLGDKAASTFTSDHHKGRQMDYIMANPPFNLKKYWSPQLNDDPRWANYGIPPESNANYAWILHILSKMNTRQGVAGFLLANGALDDSDTLEIRRKLLENDKVEAIIVLPRNMFYSTDISVTLWILNNNKKGGEWHGRQLRNREHEFLFIDLRTWNSNVYEKKYVEFLPEQIAEVCRIYHEWQTLRTPERPVSFAQPELYYSAGLQEVAKKNWCLAPSRYIEFVDRDQSLDFEAALQEIGSQTSDLLRRQTDNQQKLIAAFKTLGYDI